MIVSYPSCDSNKTDHASEKYSMRSVIPVKLVLDLIGERESRLRPPYQVLGRLCFHTKPWIPASAGMTTKKENR
jgi:hypothetical protein